MAQPSLEGVRELLGRPENADANLVPIYVELLADLETPVSAFLKLRRGDHSFLLESVENATTTTRYSFIGTEPDDLITATGGADPLVELERRMGEFRPVRIPGLDVLPPFTGGAIGYLAYDCVRFFEPRAAANIAAQADALDIPDSVFMLCNSLCVFDHARRVIQLVSHVRVPGRAGAAGAAGAAAAPPLDDAALAAAYAEAERDIDVLQSRLGATIVNRAGPAAARLVRVPKGGAGASGGVGGGGGGGGGGGAAAAPAQFAGWEESSNVGRDGYKHFVRELKGHIVNGDIIQAVPSHRVSLPMPEGVGSFDVYRQLRAVNPSPYMFYLELGEGFEVVGASPEMLVKVDAHKRVFTHPIAGTRHRGKTEAEDEALAAELLADPKERAEHIMLVDLGRNDIGRVATPGSVTVDSLMKIEKYSHVMHIVSRNTGGSSSSSSSRPGLPLTAVAAAAVAAAAAAADTQVPPRTPTLLAPVPARRCPLCRATSTPPRRSTTRCVASSRPAP